jgi:TolB-like protein
MKRLTCFLIIAGLSLAWAGQTYGQLRPRKHQPLRRQISDPRIKKGLDLYKKQRYQDAEQQFLQVLHDDARNLVAKEMLAGTYYHLQDTEQARKYALLALQQNRRTAFPLLVLAWVASTQDKMLAARDLLLKADRLVKTDLVREEIKTFKENYTLPLPGKSSSDSTRLGPAEAGTQPYLAVFPFEYNSDETDSSRLGETVSEMMVTAMAQSAHYRLLERSQLDKVLQEQALGQSGALEEQTAVEVGNLIGVNRILVGSIDRMDDRFEIDARIIEAGSGTILKAANASAADEGKLRSAVNGLVQKLNAD